MHGRNSRLFTSLLLTTALAGCAAAPPRVTEELSHDGLARVENSAFGSVWVRPGVTLASYSKLMLKGVGIQYRAVKAPKSRMASSSEGEFPLDDRQKARLEETMREVFRDELGKSKRFTIVDAPGPDVLLLVGGLLDVVSFVPPEPMGRSDIYLRSVGEATLVLELHDGATNAILARVADRRSAEQTGIVQESSSATNTFEVRRMARAWATRVRERLDAAAEMPAPPR
jgi:Protein of unknown function (DUF3313)